MWEDYVSEAAVDYERLLRDNAAAAPAGFDDYLRGRPEITPLDGLRSTSAAKDAAKAKNNAFLAQRRVDARALLRSALEQGYLPWGADYHVQYGDFSPAGAAGDPIVLSDDEVSDDDVVVE
jgi:hypothetical protein